VVETAHGNAIATGEIIAGKYRVERTLGSGGMGLVLEATHLQLGQKVAIKLLREGSPDTRETLERFAREARAAAQLRGPHVARVVDVGSLDSGSPYMVMEFLDGQDLGEVLHRRGALPVDEAVDYVVQACEAVAEAHAAGIVHRDLKPRNLFLTSAVDGRPFVKVLDFGISKMEREGDIALTQTAQIVGSPAYMSPEQLRASRDVDARTDVWSLGVVLFELLTARLPFEASAVTELCMKIAQDEAPPVQGLRAEVPAALSAAVARCLSKPRDARFASVADLVDAIEPFATARTSTASARVRGLSSQRDPMLSKATSADASSRIVVSGGTSVAWADTQAAPPAATRPRRARILLSAAAALVVVASIGIAARAWLGGKEVPAPPSGSSGTAAPPPAAASQTPLASASWSVASTPSATSPSGQPSASSVATTPTAPSTAPAASIAPGVKPGPKKVGTPGPAPDELPSARK
jgi:serine/threonine protein kinase